MNNEKKKERKPLIAMTMSMVMPGLGQIYSGELTKGIFLFLLITFSLPITSWLALHGPEHVLFIVMFLGAFLALAIYIYGFVDAYKSAKRIGLQYTLQPYNSLYFYMAAFFFGYFFVLGQVIGFCKEEMIACHKIPTTSMNPSVLNGDYIFADKRINRPGAKQEVKRGDLAIFVYPNNRSQIYIKRVLGLPGDKIEIIGNDIIVNDKSIRGQQVVDSKNRELHRYLNDHVVYEEQAEGGTYLAMWKKNEERIDQQFIVPNGQVFVLGDNRDGSLDSREFGYVPLIDMIAKAKQVCFSRSKDSGIRWSRIGKLIDPNRD